MSKKERALGTPSGRERTLRIGVGGMFCANCEKRVEKALLAIPGVSAASASMKKGQVYVTCAEDIPEQTLRSAIEALGYETSVESASAAAVGSRELQIVSILIMLLAVYVIAKHLGWTNVFNLFPAIEDTAGFGALFLIGLLTSVHCIAMCGGINMTQSVVSAQGHRQVARSNLEYNLGRVISYTVIGGIAGGIGQTIAFSGALKGIVAVIAGIAMLVMALNMLGVFKPLRGHSLHLPQGVYGKLSGLFGGRSSFVIGLLNGFMPCGPLQSMQMYALTAGSVWKGMLSMLCFSLGTVPLMFGFGFVSGRLNRKYTRYMLTVSALLIFVMGLHIIGNGVTLSGFSVLPVAKPSGKTAMVSEDGTEQDVRTEIDFGSYEAVTVRKGIPVKWTIQVPEGKLNGCNGEIVIPAFDLDIKLQEGDNLVTFTPEETGTFPYSCWMGMIKSSVTVV